MPEPFKFSVETPSGLKTFEIESGSSMLFVGANGGGKTRLAVKIEELLGEKAHRISAHRSLNLNPSVAKISEEVARNGLKTGNANKNANVGNRPGSRWQSNAATSLLNDYDFLVQTLFADQNNKTLITHNKVRAGVGINAEFTLFEKLKTIWESLVTHKVLEITGDDILVSSKQGVGSFGAASMSDGERAIFYLVGQTLAAANSSVLIFDEPELHIHRAIMSKLWDKLEAARPDCAFLLISHDLEFVAGRVGQKFVISDYDPLGKWTIEDVPEDTGFSEEITTQILGSRKPVLFVEGTRSSLDFAIYRNCYPDWTVIARGSCTDVIHSVVTLRNNASLTRITCAGIVDADSRTAAEVEYLKKLGISVLPVSEIENLFLLPSVARAIGIHHGTSELDAKLKLLDTDIIAHIQNSENLRQAVTRYCRRQIDHILKKVDLSDAKSVQDIASKYSSETASLNVQVIADELTKKINTSVSNGDISNLLEIYDNKGLLAYMAKHIKDMKVSAFKEWLLRTIGNKESKVIIDSIAVVLPKVVAQ